MRLNIYLGVVGACVSLLNLAQSNQIGWASAFCFAVAWTMAEYRLFYCEGP
jgi:hypothetical protein